MVFANFTITAGILTIISQRLHEDKTLNPSEKQYIFQ